MLKIGRWVDRIEAALLQGPRARLSALSEAGTRELQEFELNEHVDGVVSAFPKPAVASPTRIAA